MSSFAQAFAGVGSHHLKRVREENQKRREQLGIRAKRPKPGGQAQAPMDTRIHVSIRQKDNKVLKFIRNLGTQFVDDLEPDFVCGPQVCVLWLSLKYHNLHPGYLHKRLEKLGHRYNLRILLLHVDNKDSDQAIQDITRISFYNRLTVVCVWTLMEAARYLETFKSYERKPADLIKERIEPDKDSQIADVLTVIRGVNKTDSGTLSGHFRSFAGISTCTKAELAELPGIGPTKVKRIFAAFNEPLIPP